MVSITLSIDHIVKISDDYLDIYSENPVIHRNAYSLFLICIDRFSL